MSHAALSPEPKHKQIWKKIVDASPDNLQLLLSTWKVTFEEADKHICPEKYFEPAGHRMGGHRGERVGEGTTSRPDIQSHAQHLEHKYRWGQMRLGSVA